MKAQWRTVVQRAILLALAVAASDVAAQPKPALQIRPGMMEKGPPVLQNQPAAAVTAPLRLKQNVTLQQLLTMPDTTVVQSPDGRQTATVGDLRRRVQAQRQVLAAIQSGKYLTGGRASVRSARGLSTLNNLRAAG